MPSKREIRAAKRNPACKVYVKSLPSRVGNDELKEFFGRFGHVVDSFILRMSQTAYPKGSGFVTYSTPAEAEHLKELASCNGVILYGRKLQVVTPRPKRKYRDGKSGACPTEAEDDDTEEAPPPSAHLEKPSHSAVECHTSAVSPFDSLPHQCLLQILGNFDLVGHTRLERVCKKWRTASQHLWLKVTRLDFGSLFSMFRDRRPLDEVFRCWRPWSSWPLLQNSDIGKILARCPNVTHVELVGVMVNRSLTDNIGKFMTGKCQKIMYLNMSGTNVGNLCMTSLASRLLLLETLIVRGCNEICDVALHAVFTGCPALRHVDISECDSVTGTCLRALPEKLSDMKMAGCRKLRPNKLSYLHRSSNTLRLLDISSIRINDYEFMAWIGMLGNLHELRFDNVQQPDSPLSASDVMPLQHLAGLEELNILSMMNAPFLDDALLTAISQKCKLLQELYIGGDVHMERLTDVGLMKLKDFPFLHTINVDHLDITHQTLMDLFEIGQLRSISLDGCAHVEPDTIVHALAMNPKLENLKALDCENLYPPFRPLFQRISDLMDSAWSKNHPKTTIHLQAVYTDEEEEKVDVFDWPEAQKKILSIKMLRLFEPFPDAEYVPLEGYEVEGAVGGFPNQHMMPGGADEADHHMYHIDDEIDEDDFWDMNDPVAEFEYNWQS